ncbi:MAG: tetratricopeptide repeat protein [Gammaproteobacteria bacterium]
MALWKELRRRHVFRIAVAYAVAAWLLIQLGDIVLPTFGAPGWVLKVVIGLLVLFFPIALILAWAFEITPEGVRRTESADSEAARPAQTHRRVGQTLNIVIIAVLAAAAAVLAWRLTTRPTKVTQPAALSAPAAHSAVSAAVAPPQPATVIPAKSIAVLPFVNLNVDKQDAYFVAGMQDLILTKLADIGDLKVIARTSTESYGSHPENLTTVGRQLGVATLLEGSVQKAGNEVLITVQLIDAKTDAHIWAQSYQRTLENVFGVEGEVAEQIATALNAKLSPAETQRLATVLSSDPAANDLFLRAEYFANQGEINFATAAWKQAIPLYRQAIAKVPDFALARARLSYVESELAGAGGGEDVQQLTTDARSQAEQALALAPDLAEAHLAIGFSDYIGRGDYAAALTAYAAALKARPNDADALAARGYVLRSQGRFGAAIAAFQQALARDPRNSARVFDLGLTYMLVSRYAEAEATFLHALALDPDNGRAKLYYPIAILFVSGDVVRAMAAAQGDAPQLQWWRVTLLTYQRKYQQALALLAGIPDTPDNFPIYFGSKAQRQADLYRLAGDTTRAKSLYEKALPLARTQLKAEAGSDSNESFVWNNVADIELGLGHTAAGLAAGAQSQALKTRANDHFYGPAVMEDNAQLYAEAGRPDLAVPLLAKALATPGIGINYSPVLLWLDPAWDPIRHDPRFQALLKKYAKYKPTTAASSAPAAATASSSATPHAKSRRDADAPSFALLLEFRHSTTLSTK